MLGVLEISKCIVVLSRVLAEYKDDPNYRLLAFTSLSAKFTKDNEDKLLKPTLSRVGRSRLRSRKVIIATNVAETSVIFDGVVYVVDSILVKEIVFNLLKNLYTL